MNQIESNPLWDRARDALIKYYVPTINEAINSEGIGLKAINPEDVLIVNRDEMGQILAQEGGEIHPEITQAITEAYSNKGKEIQLERVALSLNAMTIGADDKKIVLCSDMGYIGHLNKGGDWRDAANFITLACHETGHYSVRRQIYTHESDLADLVRYIRMPIIPNSGNCFSSKEYVALLERASGIIRRVEGLKIEADGAQIVISCNAGDGKKYSIGAVGYNFNETLTDWFVEKIKRRAVNLFLEQNRDFFVGAAREVLLSIPTKSETEGLKTFTTESARNELRALGLRDFGAAIKAYLLSNIPQLYLQKNPNAAAYFS